MDYLKESEVKRDSVIRIYLNNKLEGYAKLIESDGSSISFLPDTLKKESDEENKKNKIEEKIHMRERWLIEWVKFKDIPDTMTTEEAWNQSFLSGKRTHRKIEYKTTQPWPTFWNEQQSDDEPPPHSITKPDDDYSDIF